MKMKTVQLQNLPYQLKHPLISRKTRKASLDQNPIQKTIKADLVVAAQMPMTKKRKMPTTRILNQKGVTHLPRVRMEGKAKRKERWVELAKEVLVH